MGLRKFQLLHARGCGAGQVRLECWNSPSLASCDHSAIEALEFLGDAILEILVVSALLIQDGVAVSMI